MADINNIVLEGRLTRAAEIKFAGSTKVATFSIATNRFYRKGETKMEEVSFFDLEAWGNDAERIEKYNDKGTFVRIWGRAKQERWEDGEGKKQSRVVFVVTSILVIPKNEAPESSSSED